MRGRRLLFSVNAAWNVLHFRRPVVRALAERGYGLTVLAPADDAVPALAAIGLRHQHLEMDTKGLNPLRDAALALRFHRHFREEAPDAILSYTIKNNIFGALAARRLGIPFIPNVTGLGTAFLSGGAVQRVAETLYRHAFRHLETVFFQNGEDRDLFVSRRLVEASQARLLPGSGIDLGHFAPAPPPDGPPVFLMIARLLRDKGVGEFVDAARIVRATRPEARFRLLGAIGAENRTAVDRPTVEGWVREGVVEYLGTTGDVRPAIAAATCVVLPSYREGAPRTLIEAAAMARPLIATDVPGCRSVVDADRSGLLVRVRDSADLARACLTMIGLSPAARAAMGAAGRSKMEHEFDESVVVAAYLGAVDRAFAGTG
jgi:glycosyltransferase involved in cell wall biosynthesis